MAKKTITKKKDGIFKSYNSIILFICGMILIVMFLIIGYNAQKTQDENYILKTIMRADVSLMDVTLNSRQAEVYYTQASLNYENGNYLSAESNCKIAREYLLLESQGYREVKAEINSAFNKDEITDKLIIIYIESLEILAEKSLNLFEACEHFESASRHYNTYFYTGVVVDDISLNNGNAEIEMMNEKIELHDKNVRLYNDKLAEYKIEIIKRLEE